VCHLHPLIICGKKRGHEVLPVGIRLHWGWTSYCGPEHLALIHFCNSNFLENHCMAIIGYRNFFISWVTRFSPLPYRKESGPRDFVCMSFVYVCVCLFMWSDGEVVLIYFVTSFKELFNTFCTWMYHTIPNFPSASFLSLCVEMEAKGLVYFTM